MAIHKSSHRGKKTKAMSRRKSAVKQTKRINAARKR